MTNQGVASKERVRREHEKALADAKRLANAIRILPTEVELENWTGYAVRAAVRLCRKEAKIDD